METHLKIYRPTVMRYLFIVFALLTACVTKADSIAELVTRVSSQPEWRYGIYPTIDLPQSAATNQVVEQIFKTTAFYTDAGIQSVKTFKILEIRQVYIPASDAVPYIAVLAETDLGRKIAIFRLEQDQKKPYWWSRVYDAEPSAHLVATQLRGAPASGTPAEFPVVYVLLFSGENGEVHPLVYQTFDSQDMELDMRNLIRHGDIAPGSILHFDPKPDLARPSDTQIRAFKEFCKKLGITFVVSKTN